MRREKFNLNVPGSAPNAGAPLNVEDLTDKTIQVSGVFNGTLVIQGSTNGTDFEPLTASINSPVLIVGARCNAVSRKFSK